MTEHEDQAEAQHPSTLRSVCETFNALVIAVVVALLAKTFVIEAFVIPTGSMAPTLLGEHIRFRSVQTATDWAVGPWHYRRGPTGDEIATPVQGTMITEDGEVVQRDADPWVTDPMTAPGWGSDTGFHPEPTAKPLRAGDRILVAKHAYVLRDPRRFEVAVFKNPIDARQNFIKRIVGLPGEQVWLVEGDVFTRPISMSNDPADTGWRVQRKPREVQEAVWYPVFSSERTPLSVINGEQPGWWTPPWSGSGWTTHDRMYTWTASGEASGSASDATADELLPFAYLEWNTAAWPLTDWNAYNDIANSRGRRERFPVGDLRLTATLTPQYASGAQTPLTTLVTFAIGSKGERHLASVVRDRTPGRTYTLARLERIGADGGRELLAETGVEHSARWLEEERPTRIRFERVDQASRLFIDGALVLEHLDDRGPFERLTAATGLERETILDPGQQFRLSRPSSYDQTEPSVSIAMMGMDAAELERVRLERDLYYQPVGDRAVTPTGPVTLGPDQFFALGDNSANSEDGRDWRDIDPVLAAALHDTPGVLSRSLLLGRAFFVYFPSPIPRGDYDSSIVPMLDAGRMRAIR